MDQSDDLPPPRRPLFFPVVIATVFLTIIAMSAGIALAAWHKDRAHDRATAGSSSAALDQTPPGTPGSGPLCPAQVQDIAASKGGAVGEVRQVLRVRTDRRTVVWICSDAAGKLFYQANRGDENATWIEGKTALFLSGVTEDGTDSYRATATDGNTFSVDRQRLLITFAAGGSETQRVVGY